MLRSQPWRGCRLELDFESGRADDSLIMDEPPGTDQDIDAVLVHELHLAGITRLRRHGVDVSHAQLLLLLVQGHPSGSTGPSVILTRISPESNLGGKASRSNHRV